MNKLQIINIHSVVNEKSIKYFNYLVRNLKHTAKISHRLFFFTHCLDDKSYRFYRDSKLVSNAYQSFKQKDAYRKKTIQDWKVFLKAILFKKVHLHGSNGHACGLNSIVRNFNKIEGHNLIIDADCAVISNYWDDIICKWLKNFDLIGTNYEEKGGYTSGDGLNQTYKKLPNAVFMVIKNGIDLSKLNWMPDKERNLKIQTKKLSTVYNLPLGYELVRDVGWRLPSLIYEKKLKVKVSKYIILKNKLRKLKTGYEYNQEYHFDNILFIGHQRGSARFEFRKSKFSKNFYKCVENLVGKPE